MKSKIKIGSQAINTNGVAKWLTALMPGRAWGAVCALAALTAMGLAFMWWCPDMTCFSNRMCEHWMFRRQVLWIGIGLSFFLLAVVIEWIMAGILVSLARDDAPGQDARGPKNATGEAPVVPVNGKEKTK